MFERFTEQARRTLFFARYEASRLGVPSIETEHLLLGLIREDTGLTSHILTGVNQGDEIRKEIERRTGFREKLPTSVEIPLSAEIQRVFQHAAEEANRLLHTYIGTEHLLLGILREERSVAGIILIERGMRIDAVRAEVATQKNLSMDVEIVQYEGHLDGRTKKISMTARHRIFESSTKPWEDLCSEATAFATQIGRERLINISVAASGGTEMFGAGGRGLIVVWYWE